MVQGATSRWHSFHRKSSDRTCRHLTPKLADVGIASQQEVLLLEPIQSYLSPSDKFTYVSWKSIQARPQRFCPPQTLVHAFRCTLCALLARMWPCEEKKSRRFPSLTNLKSLKSSVIIFFIVITAPNCMNAVKPTVDRCPGLGGLQYAAANEPRSFAH